MTLAPQPPPPPPPSAPCVCSHFAVLTFSCLPIRSKGGAWIAARVKISFRTRLLFRFYHKSLSTVFQPPLVSGSALPPLRSVTALFLHRRRLNESSKLPQLAIAAASFS